MDRVMKKAAVYDLRCAPITFDYCNFLAISKMISSVAGAAGFNLILRADTFRNFTPREKSYSIGTRLHRLDNLLLEVTKVARCVRNVYLDRNGGPQLSSYESFVPGYSVETRTGVPYSLIAVKDFYLQTATQPLVFAPSENALRLVRNHFPSGDYVTVTLRQADFDSGRNVRDLTEWRAMTEVFRLRGYRVVFIPDRDALEAGVWDFQTDPIAFIASTSVDVRLGLMERAAFNFISSGGMAAPLWYSSIPYVMFNIIHDDNPVATREYLERVCGLKVGDNFAWAGARQVLEWELRSPRALFDKYEDLFRHYNDPVSASGGSLDASDAQRSLKDR